MATRTLRLLKLLCGLVCLAVFASNLLSMSHWSERRGVADDLCYLRQAHLFQQHGLRGFSTDIAAEADGYFSRLVTEAGHPEWNRPGFAVCHPLAAATSKLVLQYPPGVGLLLALFPEGRQVVPHYAAAGNLVLLMAWIAIGRANSRAAVLGAAAFGCMALYFMINPAKASYSLAPTMVICAVVGFFAARLVQPKSERSPWLAPALIGLLLGLSVNLRVANLMLCAAMRASS